MLIRFIVSCLIGFAAFSLSGQDLHFTQFNMAPLNVNPALTGAFYGTYRAGGIYRDQWRSVSGLTQDGMNAGPKPYQTASIYVDSPIVRGFRKQDWIGVGINMFFDKAGAGSLTTSGQLISLAYHLALGNSKKKKQKQNAVLTVGGQFGSVSRKFESAGLFVPSQLPPMGVEDVWLSGLAPDQQSGKIEQSYSDWAAGVVLTVDATKTTSFRFGHAVAHFVRPGRGWKGGDRIDRFPIRNTTFFTLYADVGERYTFTPTILFQNMAKSNEIVVEALNSLLMDEEKEISINFGLGFRIVDTPDLQFLVGMDYKDIRVGLAYDVNLGGYNPATSGNGGFELAVSYIGKVYKKPKVKPVLICPRL